LDATICPPRSVPGILAFAGDEKPILTFAIVTIALGTLAPNWNSTHDCYSLAHVVNTE